MNLLRRLVCFLIIVLSFTFMTTFCAAAANEPLKAGQILNYMETFVPAEKNDAVLTVNVEGVSNTAGEIYVFVSHAKMTQMDMKVKKGNVIAVDGKPGKVGSSSFLIYKTAAPAERYAMELTFKCQDFYKGAAYEPDTGVSGMFSLKYRLVNTQIYDIVNYNVRIYLPKGREFLTVSSPKKDYIVGRDDNLDLRYLEYSLVGKPDKPAFKQAREISISAVHSTPIKGVAAGILWAAALVLGTAFFILEYKKLFKSPNKA